MGLAYGKKLSNHQKILDFSKEISETENDSSIYSAVQEGEQLHANFYHNFMTKENLIFKRKYIDRLIEKLSLILEKRLKLLEKTFVEESDFESALNLE
ncbi:MAG: PaREP1 family protein [Nanoarchaeota archaeon]